MNCYIEHDYVGAVPQQEQLAVPALWAVALAATPAYGHTGPG